MTVRADRAWQRGDRPGRRRRGDRHRHRRRPARLPGHRPTRPRASSPTAVINPDAHDAPATATATARTSRASSPATASTRRAATTRCSGKYVGVAPRGEPDRDQGLRRRRRRDRPRRDRRPPVRRRPQGRLQHPRRQPLAELRPTPQSYKTDPLDAAVEAAWFTGIVVVAAAGNRGARRRRRLLRAGQRPLRDHASARVDDRAPSRSTTTRSPTGRAAASRRTASPSPTSSPRARTSSRRWRRAATSQRMCPSCIDRRPATSASAAPRWRRRSSPASPLSCIAEAPRA